MKMRLTARICLALASMLCLSVCQQQNAQELAGAGYVRQSDPVADNLLAQGKQLMAQRKYAAAEKKFKRIVIQHRTAPCTPEARLLLGESHQMRAQMRDAFKEYGKVVELYQDSDLYTTALNRQLAMAHDAASGKLKVKVLGMWTANMESSEVEKWLNFIIENAPYNEMAATSASVLARFYYENKKFDQSRMIYQQLVENYPDSKFAPGAQLMVAQIWSDSRNRGERDVINLANAQDAYDEFLLRYPNHPEAKKARQGVNNVRRLMVQQHLDVGLYYMERARDYCAAAFCFEEVIRDKAINPEAAAQAAKYLAEARKHCVTK